VPNAFPRPPPPLHLFSRIRHSQKTLNEDIISSLLKYFAYDDKETDKEKTQLHVLRPNPEGFVYISWREREGGGMEERKQ